MSKPKKPLPKEAEPYKFKKGQSGNPAGRRPDPISKALKNMTIETFRDAIQEVMTGNLAAIKEMATSPNSSGLQIAIAAAFLKAIKRGDYGVIERIAERIVGKIPEELNVRNTTDLSVRTIDQAKLKAALVELEKDI